MTQIETQESKHARAIINGLLGRSTDYYPNEIPLEEFVEVCNLLREEGNRLQVSVLISRGTATCQFSSINPRRFLIKGKHQYREADFKFIGNSNVQVREVPAFTKPWLLSVWDDITDHWIWAVVVLVLSGALFYVQSLPDMHGFFTLAAEVLALVFTLYTLFRSASIAAEKFDLTLFESGYMYRVVQHDSNVGATAIVTIFVSLVGILATTNSVAGFAGGNAIMYWIKRSVAIGIGITLSELLLVALCALVAYYPERQRREAEIQGSKLWFEQKFQEIKLHESSKLRV